MLFSQICKSTKQQEGGNLSSQEQETSVELSQLTTGGEETTVEVHVAEDSDSGSGHTKCNDPRVAMQTGDSSGDCKTLVRTSVL